MRKNIVTALLVAACTLLGTVAFAADGKNTIRIGASRFEPTGDSTGSLLWGGEGGDIGLGLETDSDTGFEISYERRLTDLVGIEVSVANYEPDFSFRIAERWSEGEQVAQFARSARVTPVSLALNYHLLRGSKVDLYVGPTVALVSYGKTDEFWWYEDETLRAEFEDEVSLGLQAGLDYTIANNWGLSFRVKYLRMKSEIDSIIWSDYDDDSQNYKAWVLDEQALLGATEDFKTNPVTATLAVSYKF